MAGRPRRRPYPYDAVLGGTGLMLGRPDKGAPLVGAKVQPFDQTAPDNYAYDTQPPLNERVQPYDDLSLGYGQKVQATYADKKYRYSLNADASIGGLWQKGPAITAFTPPTTDATNGVARFFELSGVLYAAVGRYVLQRDGDSDWIQVADFGAGSNILDAVVFSSNGPVPSIQPSTPPTPYAFLALGDNAPMAWSSNGSTWTQTFAVQTITVTGNPTGGTFTLLYSGATTAPLSGLVGQASAIQAALQNLPGLGNVTVTGSNPYTVTFLGVGEPYALLTLGLNNLTGGTSPSVLTAQTVTALEARALCVVGSDLYRARDTNGLAKVDTNADPTNPANWGAANAFRVGDRLYPIMGLAVTATGSLIVFKQNGVYTLDDAGVDHQLYATLGLAADADSGKYYGSFGNDLHVSYGKQHVRLVPQVAFGRTHLVLEEIGPEHLTENDSPVKGRVTAFLGHGPIGAYAGVHNDDTGTSYLVKFGSWLTPQVAAGQLEEAKRADAWHGSISLPFVGQKLQALYRSVLGAPANHYRCYLGFSDGSLAWFTLPCVPNPSACSQYAYDAHDDGHVYLPLWNGTFNVDPKVLRGVTVISTNLAAGEQWVDVNYKTNPTSPSYTPLGTDFVSSPQQRVNFPNNTASYLADLDVVLRSTSVGTSPLILGVAIHHAVRPALLKQFTFSVLAADGTVARDGRPVRLGSSAIRNVVEAAAGALGMVDLILPDESDQTVQVNDYEEGLVWDERTRRWQAGLNVTAVQFIVNSLVGTVGRLSPYTVGALSSFSVQDLGTL